MRTSSWVKIAVVTVFLSTGTFAASMTATGVIQNVNTKNDAITLNDGKTYTLSEGVEAEDMKVGMKVLIVYDIKNNKMVASSVKVEK